MIFYMQGGGLRRSRRYADWRCYVPAAHVQHGP